MLCTEEGAACSGQFIHNRIDRLSLSGHRAVLSEDSGHRGWQGYCCWTEEWKDDYFINVKETGYQGHLVLMYKIEITILVVHSSQYVSPFSCFQCSFVE